MRLVAAAVGSENSLARMMSSARRSRVRCRSRPAINNNCALTRTTVAMM